MRKDLFKGHGIEVNIKSPDNFLKIKETLTRIGMVSKRENKLYQSCHILHKRDDMGISHYAIFMFKELFAIDGKDTKFDEYDIPRRNTITRLLEEWDLVEILDSDSVQEIVPIQTIKIIAFKDKKDWQLISKYTIGGSNESNGNRK